MPSDAKESKDASGSEAKRSRAAFDDDDETVLSDDAKKPPMRASIGWGNESTLASDEKESGTPDPDVAPAAASSTSESKRVGRRRKGSEAPGSSGGERRNQKNRYFEEDEETTDIMEIPDLEEEEREPDITMMVAEAPRNTTRAVQSLKQLDKDIKFALPSTTAHGVDLHLLTSALCPERAIAEEDEPWNFDTLLNDISQEIQKDVDEKEELQRLGSHDSLHLAP